MFARKLNSFNYALWDWDFIGTKSSRSYHIKALKINTFHQVITIISLCPYARWPHSIQSNQL